MIKIVVGNITSKIVGHLPQDVQEALQEILSYKVANARHMPKVKSGQWDGVIRLYWNHKGQSFYTGLMALVRETLKSHNIPYTFIDQRIVPPQNMPDLKFIPPNKYQEREYQQFTLDRVTNFTRGILQVATGGGKTMVVTEAISRIKTYPFLFFVTTKDLMQQAHDVLSGSLNTPIGMIGDGKADIQKVSVCTVQTAIMALNQNKKLKLDDYIFDDEDKWDEKGIESAEKAEKIRKLLRLTNGVYFDECVTGDTLVLTENGNVRIDQIEEKKCRYVLSYDGINVVYKKIIKWMDKGKNKTIRLIYENGEIICTEEHLIYTTQGWKEAGKIQMGEKVLFANVGAEHGLKKVSTEESENTYWDTKLKKEQIQSGKRDFQSMLPKPPFANVDVEGRSDQPTILSILSSMPEELLDIRNISMDMTNSLTILNIILPLLKKKFQPLWELVWETLPSCFQIRDLETIDYAQLTDKFKKNGLSINQMLSRGLDLLCELSRTKDMEYIRQKCGQDVCLVLQKLQELCMLMEKKGCLKNGLTLSEISVLLGGSAMMEVIQTVECLLLFILRDLTKKIITLFPSGLHEKALIAKSQSQKDIIICVLMLKALLSSKGLYGNMYPNACNTNWKTVLSVGENKEENVYDIEVEDTHCFFANGILVHNCHHAAAKTCKEVMTACTNAYWRFGGSATPYRESGDGIMIQAMFGSKIVNISASYLIKNDFLVKPYIFMEPVHSEGGWKSYAKVYENSIVKNDKFNDHIANTANHLVSRGLSTLVLVQQYPQGDYLKNLIPNSEFVSGRMTSNQRKQSISDLREKKSMCMIATTLADEGLDIPTLDAALLAGGGASATRVNQRVGRTLRKDNDRPKDKSIVVMYEHDAKYLDDHSKKVRRILKKEEEFEVMTSKGADFICKEIDSVIGLKNNDSSILNL